MQDGTSTSELRARQSPLQGELDTVKATAKPRFTALTFYSIQEAINVLPCRYTLSIPSILCQTAE